VKKDELVNIDNLEIEPLSDEDLRSVGGGAVLDSTSTVAGCSCQCCFSGTGTTATTQGAAKQAG
jgi:hypothetical protein